MNDALRSQLHDLALAARYLLTEEIRTLLTATYGISPEGKLEPIANLPAVQHVPAAAATRAQLERYLRDEAAAGRSGAAAVERLAREVAFTHLNRFVAFKLLEVRKLIRGTIDRYHMSNGFLFYLAEHPEDEARHNAGDLPQDALGEGPRDVAYRHFLLWQAAQLAREVPVLFDATNLPSQLFPRPRVLKALVDMVNAPDLSEAWAMGNEETIGWIYQYFNSEELEQAFRDVRLAGKKFEKEDIPAVTQLFTPRWIVRYLVENTLGRHWMQMHPDSQLASELAYLVPLAGEVPATPSKLVRDITLLDPACGTMHFGLVAYDLFAAMYREELERAGEDGWPAQPSVTSADDIPAAILDHNLFGIDIDLRAVQLAALSLYIRAKNSAPKKTVVPRNLVCADVTVLNGDRLGAFVDALGHTMPGVEMAIRALWPKLKQSGEFGSLLRLENDLNSLFTAPKRGKRETGMAMLPGMDEALGQFTSFNDLDREVRVALNNFARQEAEHGGDAAAFVAGAEQGFKLLDVLARRYDIVVTNPPYLSNRKMNTRLKAFATASYPIGKLDLYAAFIQRCSELCAHGGRMGMLTMHSFMFISSYEKLREDLRGHAAIECLLHLGPALFNVGNPGTLQTAAYVLRKEPMPAYREGSIAYYFRLVRDLNGDAKRLTFERALGQLRRQGATPQPVANVYRYRQGDFDAIAGGPWVYWLTNTLRSLFTELPKLEQIAQPRVGLQTGENTRFLRFWWEVGPKGIGLSFSNAVEAQRSAKRWFPYMKGGFFRRWWGNQSYVVNWYWDGKEIKHLGIEGGKLASRPQNTYFYFQQGITWSDLTSGRFAARLSPGGFIFDVKGSSTFPSTEKISLVLALLNSEFAHYGLNLLNPTVSFQVGDLARLPIPTHISETLNGLVERAITLAKQDSIESETTYDFVAPPAWPSGGQDVAARHAELAAVEREIDEEVYRLYGIEGEDRRAIEEELAIARTQAQAEGEGEDGADDAQPADDEQQADESEQLAPDRADKLAQRWVSYALGVALGRFQPGVAGAIGRGQFTPEVAAKLRALADEDGIGLIEPGHPDDLARRITSVLELMVGEDEAHKLIATATGGKPLTSWLTGDFYKEHVRQYRKRPVYWLLQSPKREYSLMLFHERLTGDSLPLILGNRYLGGKLNALRGRLGDLENHVRGLPVGRERSKATRERDALGERLADVEEFAQRIRAVMDVQNERGEVVGWQPQIDDGVLINLAPLYTLIPAWSAEPKKCWQQLERGAYDWSHTAMRYWPERVLKQCQTNKSFAIAHGISVE